MSTFPQPSTAKAFFRRFLRHFHKELLIVKHNWAVVVLTLFFNYVHAVAHNLAYYLHMPSEPLFDLGFALLPSLKKEVQYLSELAFFCFLAVSIIFLISPLINQNQAIYSKCIDSVDTDSLEELYIKPTQAKTNILSMLSRTFDFSNGYNFSFSTFSQQFLSTAPLSTNHSFSKDQNNNFPTVTDSTNLDDDGDDLNTFRNHFDPISPHHVQQQEQQQEQQREQQQQQQGQQLSSPPMGGIQHKQQIQLTHLYHPSLPATSGPYPPPHTPPSHTDLSSFDPSFTTNTNTPSTTSTNHIISPQPTLIGLPSNSNSVKQSTLTLLQSSRSGVHNVENTSAGINLQHPHIATLPTPLPLQQNNIDSSSDSSQQTTKSPRTSGNNFIQTPPLATSDNTTTSSSTTPPPTRIHFHHTNTNVLNSLNNPTLSSSNPQEEWHYGDSSSSSNPYQSSFLGLKTVQFNSKSTGISAPLYTFQMLIRILCVLSLSQSLRASCFTLTALPGPNYHCRPFSELYSPPRDIQELLFRSDAFFSCGDLVFSSHTTFMLCFALVYTHYGSIKGLKYAVWTFIISFCTLVLAARKHYSIDIWIACYTVPLIWNIFAIYCPDEVPVDVARMELEDMHKMINTR